MSAYEQIYKAYAEAQRNNFWNAWGIVASPKVVCELRAECMEHMVTHNTDVGALEKIFGLVIIPHALLDDETCYVVDEQLGRTILGHTGEWRHTATYYPYCSECGWMPEEDEMTHGHYNYCPDCGAKMTDTPSVAPKRVNVECYARNCEKNKNGRCEATDIILEFGCGC